MRRTSSLPKAFSRAPVPWARDAFAQNRLNVAGPHWLRHIGLYAYRAGDLKTFAAMPPGRLEQIESLEQLRWLENGYKIKVGITQQETIGIDTPEDMEKALKELQSRDQTLFEYREKL